MEQEKMTKKEVRNELIDWLESLMISLSVMMVIFTFFIGTVFVDGTSMVPTLQDKDRLIILPTFYSMEEKDIVVIHQENDNPLVKRIIATEGQTVNIDFDNGLVYVDGYVLQEDYIAEPTTRRDSKFIDFPVTVPTGYVFVMGDNRNNSRDSREEGIGMIKKEQIFGKVVARVFPFDSIGLIE